MASSGQIIAGADALREAFKDFAEQGVSILGWDVGVADAHGIIRLTLVEGCSHRPRRCR